MKALSPGKLILSGEHAVIYDQPALSIAVNRFAETTITTQLSNIVSFNLLNLRYNDSFTIQTLRELKNRLGKRYQKFLSRECGIRDVFHMPFELAEFVFISFFDHFKSKLLSGLDIRTTSTIPIGCGMGSSAAVILSLLGAIANYLGLHLKKERYLSFGREMEKLQHGVSSGLDVFTSLYGGCIYFEEGEAKKRDWSIDVPLFLVNTGTPVVSTGVCVSHVAEYYQRDRIWNDFGSITKEMDLGFKTRNISEVKRLVRENHRVLIRIGVVPEKIQTFIWEIEQAGAAAKICGGGATQGNKGGAVLILAEEEERIQPICKRYHYELTSVQGEPRGLHVI